MGKKCVWSRRVTERSSVFASRPSAYYIRRQIRTGSVYSRSVSLHVMWENCSQQMAPH